MSIQRAHRGRASVGIGAHPLITRLRQCALDVWDCSRVELLVPWFRNLVKGLGLGLAQESSQGFGGEGSEFELLGSEAMANLEFRSFDDLRQFKS